MTRRLALAAVAALVASPAAIAAEPMSIIDFIVDRNDISGQTVTIECNVRANGTYNFMCKSDGEHVYVGWPSDKEVLRRALKTCNSYESSNRPNCKATVTGTVTDSDTIAILAKAVIWAE